MNLKTRKMIYKIGINERKIRATTNKYHLISVLGWGGLLLFMIWIIWLNFNY